MGFCHACLWLVTGPRTLSVLDGYKKAVVHQVVAWRPGLSSRKPACQNGRYPLGAEVVKGTILPRHGPSSYRALLSRSMLNGGWGGTSLKPPKAEHSAKHPWPTRKAVSRLILAGPCEPAKWLALTQESPTSHSRHPLAIC